MISAHLPPGTRIECVDDNMLTCPHPHDHSGLDGLKKGEIYTIVGYYNYIEVAVIIKEIDRKHPYVFGYGLWRFRVVKELPASIRECLNVKELV